MRRALIAGLLVLAACGTFRKMRDQASLAEGATIRLFAKIDELDVDGIQRMFSRTLRLSHPAEKTRDIFEKIQSRVGRL